MPRATLIDHWKHLTKTEKAAARKARRARYSVRWYGPDTNPATGKPVQHRKSFPENQQAEAHLFVGRLAGDDHTQRITAASVTVHTLLERHLAAKTDRAAKTVQTDRYHAQAVDDMFGSRFVNSITPTEIEVWTQRSTVARSSRKKQLEMLRSAIHRAMRDGLVTTDPTAGIDVALGHAEVNHLTLVELLAVLDATATTFDKALLGLMGLMGLRKGEALSLRVQDVDLYRHELRVRTSGATTDTTKTRASRRSLPIPLMLEAWLDELVTGRPLDQWVFQSARKPGQPVDPTYPGNKLRLAIATANLNRQDKIKTIRPHDLRHTFASITLAENRSDLMAVSRAMGHARPSITMNHYGHLAPRGIETLFQGLDHAIDTREDR